MTNINKKSVIMSDSLAEKVDISQFYNDVDASIMCRIVIDDNESEHHIKKITKTQDEITIAFSCNSFILMSMIGINIVKKIKICEVSSGLSFSINDAKIIKQSSYFIGDNEYDCELTVMNQ
ncbi:hypothetical protein CMI47_18915 [Candidatus Pacearchaeota archaeon]|nr:hypothetical protein [Candidatus Pacearchaeota archaeon]|tara:strand:+ start:21574 stop:21936 length:363 start_codon:yes stop_codon:yes gene_type:complete